MKFVSQTPTLRLTEIIPLVSRHGAPYYKVKVADEQAFESFVFLLAREQAVESIKEGVRYKGTLTVEGKANTPDLSIALTPEKGTA